MAAADHDDIEIFRITHGNPPGATAQGPEINPLFYPDRRIDRDDCVLHRRGATIEKAQRRLLRRLSRRMSLARASLERLPIVARREGVDDERLGAPSGRLISRADRVGGAARRFDRGWGGSKLRFLRFDGLPRAALSAPRETRPEACLDWRLSLFQSLAGARLMVLAAPLRSRRASRSTRSSDLLFLELTITRPRRLSIGIPRWPSYAVPSPSRRIRSRSITRRSSRRSERISGARRSALRSGTAVRLCGAGELPALRWRSRSARDCERVALLSRRS